MLNSTLKLPFISFISYLKVQSVLLRFEIHHKGTFNKTKHTSFSQGQEGDVRKSEHEGQISL